MRDKYVIAVIIIIIFSGFFINDSLKSINQEYSYYEKSYSEKYILIKNESQNYFWDKIEKALLEMNQENKMAIQVLDQEKTGLLSQEELIELAVISRPSGILLSGNHSASNYDILEEANSEDIPVIFINEEGVNSLRNAYIGPNSYLTGQMAIQELTKDSDEPYNLLIIDEYGLHENNFLMDGMISAVNSNENIQLIQIEDQSNYRFDLAPVIRGILNDNPEINAIIGTSIYHGPIIAETVIEMNKVDEVDIIAFDDSIETLEYVDREVIKATLFTDIDEIAQETLRTIEIITKDDFSLDVYYVPTLTVTKENVSSFLGGDSVD